VNSFGIKDNIDDAYQMMCEETYEVYHGSQQTFDAFSVDHTGDGNDENGPGLYFATNEEESKAYGTVHKYEVTIDKQPSTDETPDDIVDIVGKFIAIKHDVDTVDEMLENFEEDEDSYWESSLSNFSESPYSGLESAIEGCIQYGNNEYEILLNVWSDIFGTDKSGTQEFIHAMVKMGYDGVVVKGGNDGVNDHVIMYNVDKISKIV
jgi:hypothetical protein